MGHPAVEEAAAIGVYHPKWDERPLLIVHKRSGMVVTKDDILTFLKDKVVKWWLPDDVQFVDSIPHTSTGKILKTQLRKDFANFKFY